MNTSRAKSGTSYELRCGIHCVERERVISPGLVEPDDEIVLLVQLSRVQGTSPSSLHLTVELWRGDVLRDRHEQTIVLALHCQWTGAFRLHRGVSARGSSRLVGRVLIDGAETARAEVLLGRPPVDAQGKFSGGPDRTASSETLQAFVRELHGLLQPSDSEDDEGNF